jgi:hypothetical protein
MKEKDMRPIGFCIDTEEKSVRKTMVPCDFQHAICFGMTGSGKTASLVLPTLAARLLRGHGIIAYTYKGHEHRKIKYLAKAFNRLEEVMEIGKPYGTYINLMSFLELNTVTKVLTSLIGGNVSKNGDSYWTLSAARLGVAVVDILRRIHKVDQVMTQELGKSSIRTINMCDIDNDEYEYPKGEPSFKILAEVTQDPNSLKRFFDGLDKVTLKIRNSIKKEVNLKERYKLKESEHDAMMQKAAMALLRLEESIRLYKDFTIDVNSEDGGGNNGVLQVLNNGIQNIASKDYVNTSETDILQSLNEGKIFIIDIEGLDADVHGVLLESLLSKLSRRIRHGEPTPVSVFVDEANRVLLEDTDIHNDTLRESNVELILAAQNEEQMMEKFGHVKWGSLKKNFKHCYEISVDHYVSYNDKNRWKGKAVLLGTKELNEVEYAYNTLPQNQNIFKDRFTFDGDLPKKYIIEYDIVSFEKEMSLCLIDEKSNRKEVEYIGKELKQQLENEMMRLGYTPKMKLSI